MKLVPRGKRSRTSVRTLVAELFPHLSVGRRRQFGVVLSLMLIGAVGELVTIGAVFPFLAVISDPQGVMEQGSLKTLLVTVGVRTPSQLSIVAAMIFALAALLAAGARLLLVYVSQRFIFGVAQDLSVAIYERTLQQPYAYHIGQNSSETLAAINKAQLTTSQVLLPLMQATSATVIAVFILAGLLFIDPLVAIGSGLGFMATYLAIMRVTRTVMRANGEIIGRAQGERLQAAAEGLGGIRDVIIDRSQMVFVARFQETESRLRAAQAVNNFIAQAPRYLVEGVGIALIAGLTFMLTLREGGLAAALPVLGALALGAQRLVPLMQQAYYGWAATLTGGAMLADILEILRLPQSTQHSKTSEHLRLPFDRDLVLDNVGFSYTQAARPALNDIRLVVPKGARVGFAGRTGSGKSTLMDLVLGLLSPSNGRILVDGVELTDANRPAWQARIAHVPQSIYLSDASIAENIAFGVPVEQVNLERVKAAAAQAELSEVIEALPQRYDTPVGERGVRLSGGQRQRVGIARALYKRADVLVFDEATSALDTETEAAVMHAIEALGRDITIFIIAHRLSTLDDCDMIITLEGGRVNSMRSREEVQMASS